MRSLYFMFFIFVSGCVATPDRLDISDYIDSDDEFLASFQKIQKSYGIPVQGFTGYKYYANWTPSCKPSRVCPSTISGFQYFGGKLINVFFVSSDEAQKVQDIGFEAFDYFSEVEQAKALLYEEDRKKGRITVLYGRDGPTWEMKIQTNQGLFELVRAKVNGEIDGLAPYSLDIQKLKSFIDVLGLYSGRSLIGF